MKKSQASFFDIDEAEGIAAEAGREIKKQSTNQKKRGRPRTNPYPADRRLTFGMPNEVHRALSHMAGAQDIPKGKIVVDALRAYLTDYLDKDSSLLP